MRAPDRDESDAALHVSPSFLDASDFAFELLYDEDPDALEIVEVKSGQRRVAWSYKRPQDEESRSQLDDCAAPGVGGLGDSLPSDVDLLGQREEPVEHALVAPQRRRHAD